MSQKTNTKKLRVCDQCGKDQEYAADECDTYRNCWGKECRAAPKDDMIVVSIPDAKGRKFFDFCGLECLRTWIANNAHALPEPSGDRLERVVGDPK